MGFIQGMQSWLSIQNTFDVIYHINSLKKKISMIIPIHKAKAFSNPTSIPAFLCII